MLLTKMILKATCFAKTYKFHAVFLRSGQDLLNGPFFTLQGGPGRGETGPFGGGVVAATHLQHPRNCGKSGDGGVATPWSATGGGGVASVPLS